MPIAISDSEATAARTLSRGEELVVQLSENPTTGYRWQLTQSGTAQLALVDDRFDSGTAGSAPGAGGQRVVRFVGQQPGEVKVEAVLRRDWDAPGTSLEHRVFTISVR